MKNFTKFDKALINYLLQVQKLDATLDNSSEEEIYEDKIYGDEETVYNKDEEQIQESILLNTINVIGSKGGFQFKYLIETVQNDFLPKFVMYYFNIDSIENVHFSNLPKTENSFDKLTEEELNNIDSVLNFLKQKEENFQCFKILNLDFRDGKTREASAYLFYTAFFDLYFLKQSKKQMYERCSILLCTKKSFKNNQNFKELSEYDTYVGLLFFIIYGHFKYHFSGIEWNDENVLQYFEKAEVPMIINQYVLNTFHKDIYPISAFYQLQLIFDKLDKCSSSRLIVEIFLRSIHVFINIKVPSIKTIASTFKAKQKYKKFQNDVYNKYIYPKESQDKIEINNSIDSDELQLNKKEEEEEELIEFHIKCHRKNKFVSSDEFWIYNADPYDYDEGILYKKSKFDRIKNQNDWNESFSDLNLDKMTNDNIITSKITPKIYKMFYYNEENQKWCYDPNVLREYRHDIKNYYRGEYNPFVVFIDSKESDIKTICSNYINFIFPDFESDDRILVYIEGNPKMNKSVPHFLILHIPESKRNMPNIQLISIEIYAFLLTICSASILVLNDFYYKDQISFIKKVIKISETPNFERIDIPYIHLLFLIDGPKYQYSLKINQYIYQNDLFIELQSCISNSVINYFNANDYESYKPFIDKHINDANCDLIGTDFEYIFNLIQYFDISPTNIYYIINMKKLKKKIHERFSMISQNSNENMKIYSIFSQIVDELTSIFTKNGNELLVYCQSIFSKIAMKKFGECHLKKEIKKRSKKHLSYLKSLIDKKNEFSKEQLRLLTNKHIKYLKDEYFKIIHLSCEENQLQKAYNDMISILDRRIEEDKVKIEDMYKSFIQRIDLQRKAAESNTKEMFLQGSNYSMKESENTKEIMISIEINKDLESEIEQDF